MCAAFSTSIKSIIAFGLLADGPVNSELGFGDALAMDDTAMREGGTLGGPPSTLAEVAGGFVRAPANGGQRTRRWWPYSATVLPLWPLLVTDESRHFQPLNLRRGTRVTGSNRQISRR
jgi:hypothetical protein